MALKTLLFLGIFAFCAIGAIFTPILGILGYVGHYCIGPERQWWHAPISFLGLRYSLLLAALTALSMVMHWGNLRFGTSLFHWQEILLLGFLVVIWVATIMAPQTVGAYTAPRVDHPSVKFTKVLFFTLMLTHVVTTRKNLDRLIWVLIVGAMILGMQAWSKPYSMFQRGRLEGVGGPDFSEANFFAAFMATILWIIGIQFLRTGWRGKIVCFLSAGFSANAVVLSRSRGALVGLLAGALIALVSAPRRLRGYIFIGLLIGGAGLLYLSNEQFLDRMSTILAREEERDTSAHSRIALAKAGFHMWLDHPMGVGPGNFFQNIGNYIPEYAGKDAHNTYVRCLTETGLLGAAFFVLVVLGAFWTTYRTASATSLLPEREATDIRLLAFGMACAVATLLTCCLTISLTYVEYLWWFLMLPVCLQRAANNLIEDHTCFSLENQRAPVGEGIA